MSNTFFIKNIAKITNGKSDVKDANNNGKYLFFDRSSTIKKSDKYLFDSEAIIIPGEDSRQIFEPKYYHGKFNLHQRCYVIYDFKDNFFPKYLFYKLKTLTKHFKNVNVGSTVPSLRLDHITDLKIKFPCFEQQQRIANVLSSLDSKIELNNKINKELEAMAKTLYDYWFVQFDFPDENGKPYKSSGGKMVYNQELKREIPENWEVKTIDKIIDVKDGTHDSPKTVDKGFPLITSKNLLENGLDFENTNLISEHDYNNINKRSEVETGDILFSMIGSIGVAYKVEELDISFAIKNVALYKTSKKQEYKNYIYQSLKSFDMKKYMGNVTSGSIQKFIGLGSLRNMPILFDQDTIYKLEDKLGTLFLKLENNKQQNQELAKLRDWLLPMLMNGQVIVNLKD